MSIKIEDLSVIRLTDGRVGTIVHTYSSDPTAYCVELEGINELVDVHGADVEDIIWTPARA